MNDFVRVVPGIPRECRNIIRTHNDLGFPIYELMTPKQRYKLQKSERKWKESEAGKEAEEILKSYIMQGEVGYINNFRFILT